ncbi:DUF4192 domain-containing protein [Nocardia sp. NPDC006044]|uniref:DUF4192 domain-containing protein n=1 Tax=Nocardia sp. NPDC006044 TaxID=3364306 RepID=UPI0036C2629C
MDQLDLLARVTRLVQHELLGPGWSAPHAEDDSTVTLAGPGRHLLIFEVETGSRPECSERVRVHGSFGDLVVPEGVRPHPSIYVAIGENDRQWARRIRRRLLGGGSRGKNYTAALTAVTALHQPSAAGSVNAAPGPAKHYPDPAKRTAKHVVRVQEPGELIIGIPAMIGFPPHRSLVLLLLRAVPHRTEGVLVDAVVRLDLDQDNGRIPLRAETVVSCITQISPPSDLAGVLAVVVDDRVAQTAPKLGSVGDTCRTRGSTSLIDDLDRLLIDRGIPLAGAWMVRAIEPKQSWCSLLGAEQHGTLPDTATSALALAHVLDGRPFLGSRAELTALVAEDVELQRKVAPLMDSALVLARERYSRAVRRGDPLTYSRQILEYVLWQLDNIEDGYPLAASELAELAVALRDRAVRDAMFAIAVGDHAMAAENLFSALARACSGRERAEATALLAFSSYTRGNGPLTEAALEAALAADTKHPLARLLEKSLALRVRPEMIRSLARSGYDTAAELGIDLHD